MTAELRLTGSFDIPIGEYDLQQRTHGGQLLLSPARTGTDGRISEVDRLELRTRQWSQETEQVLLASLSSFATRSHTKRKGDILFVSSSSSSRVERGT